MDVGKFQKQWSDDVIEELCRRHRAGESIRKLSAESGIPRETLRRRFKQARLAADHATRAHRQQRSKPDPNRPETLPAQPLPYEEQAKLDEAAREAKSRAFAAANPASAHAVPGATGSKPS